MTQPQPPYPPQQPAQQPYGAPYATPPGLAYYAQPMDTALAPARRAAILMWILGTILLLCGGIVAGMGALMPTLQSQPEVARAMQQVEAELHMSPSILFLVLGVVLLIVAILYIALGFFVRRGGLGAVVTAIVLTAITILWLLLNTVAAVRAPQGAISVCMGLCTAVLFVLLLVWLIQAARNSSQVKMVAMQQAQYQAGYWQQYQPAQSQQPPGYGYGQQQQPPQQPPPH